MRLQDKVAIVTGGGRGIGRATAELFSAEGAAAVYAVDLEIDKYSAERVTQRELDVGDLTGWKQLVADVVDAHGRIDVLVNNAGAVLAYETITEIDPAAWERALRTNLTGSFYGMREVIPVMRGKGGGSVVNTSSVWGVTGTHGVTAYQAAKGGVRSLSKNAAITYASDGVRVNTVIPGLIETPAIELADPAAKQAIVDATPLARGANPSELAQGVLFLASDDASFVTGSELVVDGGFLAL